MNVCRELAKLVFRRADKFGRDALGDFPTARTLVENWICDPEVRFSESEQRLLSKELRELDDWRAFFQNLCSHTLFSGELDSRAFLSLWDNISGFDVDGLLEAGDPAAASARKDSEYLPKYDLGTAVFQSLFSDDHEQLNDEHIHFGQMGDINLVWLAQLGSVECRLGQSPDFQQPEGGLGANERRKQELAAGKPGLGGEGFREIAQTESRYRGSLKNRDQRACWDENLSKSRLLMAIAEKKSNKSEALKQFFAQDHTPDRLAGLEELFTKELDAIKKIPLADRIRTERALISKLNSTAADSDEDRIIAVAYLLAKNCAFTRVASISVSSFDSFTRSLSVLDHIYGLDSNLFDSQQLILVYRDQLERCSSGFAEVRYRLNPDIKKNDRFWQLFRGHCFTLLGLTRQDPPNLTLAFSRHDFETSREDDFHALAQWIVDNHKEWDANICGIDLIGPEARSNEAWDGALPIGGTSHKLLNKSLNFVFDLRNKLENASEGAELFVTIHAGEHFCNDTVGVISMLSLLADNRFRPELDRISHALILRMSRDYPDQMDCETRAAVNNAIGNLRSQERSWRNELFSTEEKEEVLQILNAYQEKHDASRLCRICEFIEQKVKDGKLIIEICPYSNQMIRAVDPKNHPWSEYYGQVNVLVGTDDPSLTQTLPWMERTALLHAENQKS